ncbi:MAG: group II intron reverse transcriptase/maturase [Candidatus Dormibacteria bacterium]
MAEANSPRENVRALQRALYVAAKRNGRRKFPALYDRIARPDVLQRAFEQVRRNKGAAGIDGETLAAIEAKGVEQVLTELRELLESGKYRPQATRRVYIPKPGRPKERRPLSIPRVRDRVLQTAARLVLEPIFEASFLPCSYGFRPRRSAHQALESIRKEVNNGSRWVVEVDFRDFFGSLDPGLLLGLVAQRISDRRVLRLIRKWMRAGVMEDGVTISTATGVPQGGSISPLLSNIYGHALDALWAKESSHLGTIVRYADDAVILCRSETDAQHAYRWLQGRAQALKLVLHPDKTRLVDLSRGADGFDFLGFHLRLVKSRRYGRWYCQRWPSGRAMASVRAKVKAITAPRSRLKQPIGVLVTELNSVLRGWGNYFKWGNSTRKFSQIDSYVQARLALFDSKKRQKRGRRWGTVHTAAWYGGLGVFSLSGTIRYGQPATATT